jgi:predicted nucleotidyltransferase
MGMADALFSETQQRVLGLVFGQPDRSYRTNELIKLADVGSGSVQRELTRLVSSGLVSRTKDGGHTRYQANRSAPIFEELATIIEKTSGVAGVVQRALEPIASKIDLAILYGSVAKREDNATSDIDVLVVSDDVALEELFEALEAAEVRLGRKVNPSLYTRSEFRSRRTAKHPFLTKVLASKHVVLLGDENVGE